MAVCVAPWVPQELQNEALNPNVLTHSLERRTSENTGVRATEQAVFPSGFISVEISLAILPQGLQSFASQ